MLSVIVLIVVMQSNAVCVIMLSVVYAYCHNVALMHSVVMVSVVRTSVVEPRESVES